MESDPLNGKPSLDTDQEDLSWKDDPEIFGHRHDTLPVWALWLLVFACLADFILLGNMIRTGISAQAKLTEHRPGAVFGVLTSFEETDLRYQSLDRQYDHLWNARLSEDNSTGILDVPDSAHTSGLQRLGGIAMFHQLHCLYIIREDIRRAIDGEDISANWLDSAHGNHCLDYVRKAITCYADPTIERPMEPNPDGAGGLNLEIMGHERRMCRSAEPLRMLREEKMVHDFKEFVN